MFIENVWNDGILLISKRRRKDRNKNYFVLELHGLKRKKLYDDVGVERCITDCSVLCIFVFTTVGAKRVPLAHSTLQSCPIFAYRKTWALVLWFRSGRCKTNIYWIFCTISDGSLSHKTTPVQVHRGFRLLTLASYDVSVKRCLTDCSIFYISALAPVNAKYVPLPNSTQQFWSIFTYCEAWAPVLWSGSSWCKMNIQWISTSYREKV